MTLGWVREGGELEVKCDAKMSEERLPEDVGLRNHPSAHTGRRSYVPTTWRPCMIQIRLLVGVLVIRAIGLFVGKQDQAIICRSC